MLKSSRKIRDQKGAAVTGLVIALMFFILMAGFFCFDASRVQMAQRELTATCDAAALAGTAMLTSYDVSNDTGPPASPVAAGQKLLDAQNNSGAYAYNMFLMGNILGRWVRNQTNLVSNLAGLSTTTDGECNVCIGLVNPQNNFATVPPTIPQNANGTAIGVYAGYGYHPIFISFFGVGNIGIRASSVGGLPQVDAIVVLDLSASMDDLTTVTLVKRYWDAHRGSAKNEREPGTGYSGANPDSKGWSDAANEGYQYVNQALGTSAYTSTDITTADLGSQPSGPPSMVAPTFSSEKNGSPDGVADFDEFSGTGCITYLEAPHWSTDQAIYQYIHFNATASGTALNALPPQNLSFSERGVSAVQPKDTIVFKRYLRMSPDRNDFNSPPGNCPCVKQSGGSFSPICSYGWSMTGGRTSPYKNYETDHLHYPLPPCTGMYNTPGPTILDHSAIYTDLVVNFGQATTQTKPIQPAWGQQIFEAVTYQFSSDPNVEEDADIRNNTYTFQNIAVLVEAARGNLDAPGLDGTDNFNSTGLHRGYDLAGGKSSYQNYYAGNASGMNTHSGVATPQIGYQKAYQRLAMWYSQPVATCIDSCDQAFFQRLAALTDCRFGLVGFSDRWTLSGNPRTSVSSSNTALLGGASGTSQSSSCTSYYYDTSFQPIVDSSARVWDGRLGPSDANCATKHENRSDQTVGGGTGLGFRLPRTPLDSTISKSDALRIIQKGSVSTTYAWSDPNHGDGLYAARPLSMTQCSEALETARLSFGLAPYNGATRPGSKRAIVFFTDGLPAPSSEAGPSHITAQNCKTDGIAVFCIGLNMLGSGSLTSAQTAFLGNGSGGLSGEAKNGGRFFMCGNVNQVQQAFSAIARRLTQSQK